MDRAILLADAMIYYHNCYKAFKIGDSYLHGLIDFVKEYQEIYIFFIARQ